MFFKQFILLIDFLVRPLKTLGITVVVSARHSFKNYNLAYCHKFAANFYVLHTYLHEYDSCNNTITIFIVAPCILKIH